MDVHKLAEVPGRYENAVPVPRVFVAVAYRSYRSSGYGYECPTELTEIPGTRITQVNTLHGPRGGLRFGVEDSIELAWHVLTGPTSPRQSVVALKAIDNNHRGEKSLTSTSGDRGQQPRSRLLFCNRSYHSVPWLWRPKTNVGGRKSPVLHTSDISAHRISS